MSLVVETKALCRTYTRAADDVEVLRDVSLSINAADFVAIMGASGSGKSTLLHILGLLDKPTSGSFRLDGEPIDQLSHKGQSDLRCRKIGFVFQNFSLLPRSTALENVELPLFYAGVSSKHRARRANEALEAVGLAHRAKHWPHQLSGGEQQRVAIARAIVNRPLLMLADEPTGSLDSKTGASILELFQKMNRDGQTIVLVTHDAEIASHANRVVRVRDGEIVSEGATGPRSAAPLVLRSPTMSSAT